MADDSGQEKTFDPTPRRLQQARDEGQVAKSNEVPTAIVTFAAGVGLISFGGPIMVAIVNGARHTFMRTHEAAGDVTVAFNSFATSIAAVGLALLPFFGVIMAAGTFAHVAQTGPMLSPKALMPKFDRLNPFKRVKDILGPVPAGMRATVALLKVTFVGIVVTLVIAEEVSDIRAPAVRGLTATMLLLGDAVITVLVSAGVALLAVAVIDFAYQRFKHNKQLKMTREEVKREQKEDEGTPEMKAKRKGMHREMTLNRVLDEVPKADVVVTNPTHFAVALRYEAGVDMAPRVVAKGVDAMALTIRRVGRQNGVPIMENRALARTLYRKVKVGHPVPMDLFQAVAEVLAHVYRIKKRLNGGNR